MAEESNIEESNKTKLSEIIEDLQDTNEENKENVSENKSLLSETISEFKQIAKTYIELAKLNRSAAKAYTSSDYTPITGEPIPEDKTKQEIIDSTPQLEPLLEISSMLMTLIKTNNENHERLYKLFIDQYRIEDIRRRELESEQTTIPTTTTAAAPTMSLTKGIKGVTNFLKNLLETAFLGKQGKALLKSLIPKSFDKNFGLVLVRGIAGALIGPEFLKAINAAMEADGLENKISVFFDEIFHDQKTVLESMGIGALAGLAVLGPSGIIIGGILAGVYNAFSSYFKNSTMSEDDKEALKKKIKSFIFGDAGAMAIGALVGFKAFGIPGLIIGAGVVAAGSIISSFIENYNKSDQKTDSEKIKEAALKTLKENPVLTGLLAGGTVGGIIGTAIGGPVGGVTGAIIGAGIGAIGGILTENILSKTGPDSQIDSGTIKNAVLTLMKENSKFAALLASSTIGGLIGAFGGGPIGAIAGVILGAGVGLVAGPLVDDIIKSDSMTTGAGKLSDAVEEVMKKNPTIRRITLGATTGGLLGAISGGPVGLIAGAIIGAGIGYMIDLVDKDLLTRAEANKKAGSNTPMRDAIYQSINENPEIAKWGSTIVGAAVGSAVAGPVGLVAGAFLGYSFGKVSEIVAGVFERQQQNPNEPILNSIAKELLKTPVTGAAAVGALAGGTAGLVYGPLGVLLGMVVGGVLGAAVGAIIEQLEKIGLFDYLGDLFEKFQISLKFAMEGEFQRAYDIMNGKLALTEEGIKKLIDEGRLDDAIRSLALVATNIPEKIREQLEEVNEKVSEFQNREKMDWGPYAKKFKEFLTINNIDLSKYSDEDRNNLIKTFADNSGLSFERKNYKNQNEKRYIENEWMKLLNYVHTALLPLNKSIQDQEKIFRLLATEINGKSTFTNIDVTTPEGKKYLIERIFRTLEKTPPPIEENYKGSYINKPTLTTVGEKGPEMILNQEQIYGVTREILNQRFENEVLKMSAGQVIMPPPIMPNVVDNKRVSIQETFNVTEILPMPSSHFSLMDAA